ncbi:fatty acid-binding protein DegV [Sporanaerobium hydrogeniformans]|uniref:Fatty acid-binding protein DegV n=1 Tax=Sporanaerobium hydrogeniformans TaxID=3072179 RepID=A0AC61DCX1_9FIRM|nr:DegV family protein [Sporanaerobium hydrogeniformans]PHV70938.1 fatty acid-binding protein DegV [Sporanaerobium hydrogeniformans]
MKIVLMTDSCCDLPYSYVKENNIIVLPLTVNLQGENREDDLGRSLTYKDFYNAVRSGEMPTTSQVNEYTYEENFKRYADTETSIIYIGFSSALSGSVNSARLALKEIQQQNLDFDITIIDSKSASLGQGLLVYYACEFIKQGKDKEFVVNWIETNKLKINHWFTVEDLNHLYRGGRVSKTAATLGSLLSIKPILQVDVEGRLIPVSKVKGRKKSLRELLDRVKKNIVNPQAQVVFISHGDCEEDIEELKKQLLEEVGVKDVVVNCIGPVVGTHAGPGTVAVFFQGEKR